MSAEYDYIIIGSGAGGSTLAYRLASTGRERVLVLEAGEQDTDPLHRVPLAHFLTEADERHTYRYPAGPTAESSGETWIRGRVVGGSTTVNGMIYSRGQQPDFDRLAVHTGSPHWGWDNVLDAYRAMEDHELGASATRGAGGPFAVSAGGADEELAERVFGAAKALGWRQTQDVNDADDQRIGYTPTAVGAGVRTSAASAFLRPALAAGVTLETGTRAERILFSGRRAIGVAARRGTTSVEYRARKEVVIACGAIESPLLLERSGIGRPNLLRSLGIDLTTESPNVGERLAEHHMTMLQVRFTRALGSGADLAAALAGLAVDPTAARIDERGVHGRSGYAFTFHMTSEPGLSRPDIAGHAAAFTIDPTASGFAPQPTPGMLFGLYQLRPETTGSVHSSGLDTPPDIRPRYLETDTDRRAAGAALGRVRELLATAPLSEVIAGEDFPGAAVPSDPEAALGYARAYGIGAFHGVGSCAMGGADDDVTDPELRVRGVDGLRVVDASVLPFQVSANSAAPVMALGWLAADLFD